MKIVQNRIKANNPDKAAMKVRKKHDEFEGRLNVKWLPLKNMYEYSIEVREDGN